MTIIENPTRRIMSDITKDFRKFRRTFFFINDSYAKDTILAVSAGILLSTKSWLICSLRGKTNLL